MKNNNFQSVSVFVMGCLVALLIAAQAAPDARQTFQPLYKRWDKANINKDLDIALSNHSPNFLFISESGKQLDLDAVRANLLKNFDKYKAIHSKTVVQSVKVVKDGATVVVRVHLSVTRDSDTPGQEVTFTTDEVDRDYWVESASGWQLKQERVLSIQKVDSGK